MNILLDFNAGFGLTFGLGILEENGLVPDLAVNEEFNCFFRGLASRVAVKLALGFILGLEFQTALGIIFGLAFCFGVKPLLDRNLGGVVENFEFLGPNLRVGLQTALKSLKYFF